jgi:hypothetical protein
MLLIRLEFRILFWGKERKQGDLHNRHRKMFLMPKCAGHKIVNEHALLTSAA